MACVLQSSDLFVKTVMQHCLYIIPCKWGVTPFLIRSAGVQLAVYFLRDQTIPATCGVAGLARAIARIIAAVLIAQLLSMRWVSSGGNDGYGALTECCHAWPSHECGLEFLQLLL